MGRVGGPPRRRLPRGARLPRGRPQRRHRRRRARRLMRVLMLSELYPPFIGGSEEYVRNLSRGLVERGHQVSVATIAADNEPSTADEDGVIVHRLRSSVGRLNALMPSGRPYHAPAPDPDVTLALRRIMRDERPEVVHAHNWMVSSFL